MATPTLEVKFDGSNWDDVSSYIRRLSVRRGRANDLDVVEPGVLSVELDNDDGRFTPENTQGAYTPDVKPGVAVRLTVTGGELGTDYRQFTGEAQRWEPVWTVGGRPVVRLEAVDGFEKLRNIQLRYPYLQECLDNDVVAFWPLHDTGSTFTELQSGRDLYEVFDDPVNNSFTQGGAALTDGGLGSFTTDDDEFIAQRPAVPSSWVGESNDLTFSGWVNITTDDTGLWTVARMSTPPDGSTSLYGWSFSIQSKTASTKALALSIADGSTSESVESNAVSWSEDTTYHIGFHWDQSTSTVTFYRNGSSIGSDTFSSVSEPVDPGSIRVLSIVREGAAADVAQWGDFALWTSDQSSLMSSLYNAGIGYRNDTPGDRIGRLLDWSGWSGSDRDIDTGTTSLAALSSDRFEVLSACQDAASADGGVFYISKSGDAVFQGRRNRWEESSGTEYTDEYGDEYGGVGGAVVQFDDDGTATGYQAIGWRYDTTMLSNNVAVDSGTQGVSDGRAEDSTSQTTYGVRTLTVSTISNDTDDNAERAQWELSRRKDPHLRVEEVGFLVGNAVQEDTAATLELQDRVDVNRRPGSGQDDITAEMRVSSITHDISEGGTVWRTTVGLLEASTDQPGVYGEAEYGTDYYGY